MRKREACLAVGLLIFGALQRDAPPAYASALPAYASALPTYASALPVYASALPAYVSVLTAYASALPAEAQMGTVEFPYESSANVESELKGKIKVDLISVELPAGGFEFSIDTTKPFSPSSPGEQIQSPAIRVANHSVVPVKVEISQVAEIGEDDVTFTPKFGNGPEQKFQLLDRVSEVGAPGTAVLVLGTSGKVYSNETDFEQYAILPGRKNIFITRIGANESTDLNLYGKVSPDFYGKYEFTVSPTIKISTINAAD